jgi:hypothetical protein
MTTVSSNNQRIEMRVDLETKQIGGLKSNGTETYAKDFH